MEADLVGAADEHARALAHRLQAFENLDVLGGIVVDQLERAFPGETHHDHLNKLTNP